MRIKDIFLLGVVVLFTKSAFSQDFVQNISGDPTIALKDISEYLPNDRVLLKQSYSQQYFVTAVKEVERSYFANVGPAISLTDSISISNNFSKLSRTLSRQYKKETKKVIKRLKFLDVVICDSCDYEIQPRYLLIIEEGSPAVYTIKLEYVLVNTLDSNIYRITD